MSESPITKFIEVKTLQSLRFSEIGAIGGKICDIFIQQHLFTIPLEQL
jgi:hypothetical protein